MVLLQPLEVRFLTIWLSCQCHNRSKNVQNYRKFYFWKYGQKQCFQVWTGQKLLYCMKRGTQKGKYLKNWSSVKTAIHQQYLPPLLSGPVEVRLCKGISLSFHGRCKPSFCGKFVGSEPKLITETTYQGRCLTSAPVSNKSDQIFSSKVVSKRTTIFFLMWSSLWLVTLGLLVPLKSWKLRLESGNCRLHYLQSCWTSVCQRFTFLSTPLHAV